ncbi:MAG: Gfo/Idh/MocA family oxidoreductase, partial [Deltaproteobacteria bacterium]
MGYTAAIVGCGRVAWMLEDDPLDDKPCTHAGAYIELAKTGRVSLIAAADVNEDRLAAFGGRFEAASLYPDYRRMLKEVRPDVVSVCAYATERFPMVMDAIDAGVRGIWCEKAFASSLQEARIMTEACAKDGIPLIVSHMRRWSPQYRKVKEMMDAGAIGRLESVVSRFSGSLIHTGTHAFDVLRWFCGPVEWVEGGIEDKGGRMAWDGAEDRGGRALIQFKNGAYATVHAETKNYFLFEFDIIGTDGRIRIGNNDVLEYYTPEKSRNNTGIM